MKPPAEPTKTKGALKKIKLTLIDNSIKQSPSYFEHVNSPYLDYPNSQSKINYIKGARINKPLTSPHL